MFYLILSFFTARLYSGKFQTLPTLCLIKQTVKEIIHFL